MQNTAEDSETLTFLLLPRFSMLCLANAVEPLRAANMLNGNTLYQWQLVSTDGQAVASSSGLRIDVDGRLGDVARTDGLFVIASYDYDRWPSPAFNARLHRAAAGARVLGGLDTGAWILASLGLLDGYRATIHWQELARMTEAFPDVACTAGRYVVDGARITAGGATTVLDLMLHLVRVSHGDTLALQVMRLFLYEIEGRAESPQQGRLATPSILADSPVGRAIQLMEEALETPLALPDVADRAGCSQRQLERGFAAALECTPQQYYQLLRLSEARRMILGSSLKLAEIAARTGFASAAAFSRAFRRQFGETPSGLRRQIKNPRHLAAPRV